MMKRLESQPQPLKTPLTKTLRKYGLSKLDWLCIAARQDSVCGICGGRPLSGRLHIDHEHIKNWRKLPPQERSKYVRGLACFRCNSQFLRRGMNLDKAKKVVAYLTAYATVSGGGNDNG